MASLSKEANAARMRLYRREQKEADRRKRTALYKKWKSEGRCVNCSAPALSPGFIKCVKCRERARLSAIEYYRRVRAEMFARYGGQVCACCGTTEPVFLNIDHMHNNGAEERRRIGLEGGRTFYAWLKKNNYPPGYQVLCFNCNIGRYLNGGVCPHARGS